MSEPIPPDYTATMALKRVSPAWAWVRQNVTIPVILSVGGMFITAGSAALKISLEVGELRKDVSQLTEAVKASQGRETEIAVLQQHVLDMDQRLHELQTWKEWADREVDRPDPRLRHRPR